MIIPFMNKKKVVYEFTKNLHVHSASLLLILLLSTDLAFFAIHSITILTPFINNSMFYVDVDEGYPELYQYIKWFWILAMFVYLSIKRRSLNYSIWGIFFTYLLLDDSLEIHENVGTFIASHLTMTPPFGLRLQDIGELAVTGIAGTILFSLVLWTYINGSRAFRKMSIDILLLIFALVFFGVFVDMAHEAIKLGKKIDLILAFIEDGGEMIVASFICWYMFLLCIRDENTPPNLFDFIRSILSKRST